MKEISLLGKNYKKDNIVRCGDLVKVIKPELFVRCGYSLTLEKSEKIIREKYYDKVSEFANGFKTKITLRNMEDYCEDSLTNKIIQALAEEYIFMEGFGGNERKIYTEPAFEMLGMSIKDEVRRVVSIKFHKTGTYVPGSSIYPIDEYYDYEPAYLDNTKTHKILGLAEVPKICGEYYGEDFKIEACNVEKLHEYNGEHI